MEALQHFSDTMTAVGQALDQAVNDPAVQQAFGDLEKILAGQQASEARLLAELQEMQTQQQGVLQQLAELQAQLGAVQGDLDELGAKQGN